MALGLNFDSSSKSTTDERTSGSQSQYGPSITVVGGTNSKSVDSGNTTVNITDGGVVSDTLVFLKDTAGKMFSSFGDLAQSANDLGIAAIDSNERTTANAIDGYSRVVDAAGAFGREALYEAFNFGESALDTVRDGIDANRQIAQESLYQAQSVVDLTEKINKDNLFFLSDVSEKQTELFTDVTGKVIDSTGLVIDSISDLEESRQIESSAVIKTIKDLAEVVQTGGESISTNANKIIVLAVIIGAVVLGWRATK